MMDAASISLREHLEARIGQPPPLSRSGPRVGCHPPPALTTPTPWSDVEMANP
jgi:hypothetical protein